MSNVPENIIRDMINKAIDARKFAYTPYSNFKVGAALLTKEDEIITGCNIENAAYSPGNCGERTAVFKAVSQGIKDFKGIAIVAGKESGELEYTSPCGMCRQVLREFVNPEEFIVVMAKSESDYKIMTLEELFPMSFGPDNLR